MTSRVTQLINWLNEATPYEVEQLELVSGDASFRRYYRFQKSEQSYIAVDAPPETENNEAFLRNAELYQKANVRVPSILHFDSALGFMCLEDFGDLLLSHVLTDDNYQSYYSKALNCLRGIQSISETKDHSLPPYDDALLRRDFSLFTDWLIGTHLRLEVSESEVEMLEKVFHLLSSNFDEQPQVAVHRDFHSRNIMLLEDDELGIIDFQDTAVGPLAYDIVSLLRDCYVRWPDDGVISVLKSYHQQYLGQHSWEQFKRWFDLTGIQRHIKAIGIFARLHHRDGKSIYLQDIPRTLSYIVDIGKQYHELTDFIRFLENRVIVELRKHQ